jgi:hypothetical protein
MNLIIAKVAYPFLGGVMGFLYYKFIGCPSGACPITANPYTSTLYGLLIGFALSAGK